MGRPLVSLDLPLEHLPSEREVKQGAALLALLQQDFGPVPIGLAEAPRTLRMPALRKVQQAPASLPLDVEETLLCPGAVVELTGDPGHGALSVALRLAHAAWLRHPERWMAVVSPERPLHAPALAALGLPLSRLLVVDPEQGEWPRLAVRVTKSDAFAAVIVDATAVNDLTRLPVPMRRLALAAEETGAVVFFLTSTRARRGQTLPAAVRAHVHRSTEVEGTLLEVKKHRGGRYGAMALSPAEDRLPAAFSEVPSGLESRAGKPRRKVRASQARGARGRRRAADEPWSR